MTYRGFGSPKAPIQLFMESIVALGPATFRPTSSVAQLSALGDDFPPDCLLAGIRQSPSPSPRAHTALEDKENLAHPTRFERVTFAFGGQTSPLPIAGQRFPPNRKHPQRDSGFRDVANVHHRAKHSRHHTKDKKRFVVSVVAYDSLPGHQSYDIPRFSTTLYDAAPIRERNVVRQLIDRSTLHWRSLVTWRGLIRRMGAME
jgi:hypothetical protein